MRNLSERIFMSTILPEKIIFYSIADMPDNCTAGEELDLAIKWETVISENEDAGSRSVRNSEMNELLDHKVRSILHDKNGCCVRIKKEDISHSINYSHGSHIVRAEYKFIVYRN